MARKKSVTTELEIQIKGSTWKIYSLSERDYMAAHGDDSAAITLGDKKEIVFCKGHYEVGYIRHELLHAIKAELGVDNLELSAHQLEEFFATVVQNDYSEILRNTDVIVNALFREIV